MILSPWKVFSVHCITQLYLPGAMRVGSGTISIVVVSHVTFGGWSTPTLFWPLWLSVVFPVSVWKMAMLYKKDQRGHSGPQKRFETIYQSVDS